MKVYIIVYIRMHKILAHMVWWYFHSCAVLNFTDGMSGVNHSLAGGKLSLLLYLVVSSALYVLLSVWVYVSELSLSLSTLHNPWLCNVNMQLLNLYVMLDFLFAGQTITVVFQKLWILTGWTRKCKNLIMLFSQIGQTIYWVIASSTCGFHNTIHVIGCVGMYKYISGLGE